MSNAIVDTLAGLSHDDADRKRAFGNLLRRLRCQLKLSRHQLEQLSSIPQRTIVDIEKAEKAMLDRKTVILLAQALGLRDLALREFVSVAGLVPDHPLDGMLGLDGVVRKFYATSDLPVYVTTPFLDLHSCNSYLLALLGVSVSQLDQVAYRGAGPNALRFLFDPVFKARDVWADDWCKVAHLNVRFFRHAALPYMHKPRYGELLQALRQLPDFEQVWRATPAAPEDVLSAYNSTLCSAFGLARITHMEVLTDESIRSQLRLVMYVPFDEQTRILFETLRKETVKSAIQFGSTQVARFSRIL